MVSAAACSWVTPAGFRHRAAAGCTQYSAWLPRASTNSFTQPKTSSPTANPVTPGPSAETVPLKSPPRTLGILARIRSRSSPLRALWSSGLRLLATTATCTSPGPGAGIGRRSTWAASAPP